mmetsp:Transcript_4634/g.16310  ORF Transcript_4634/g.16310 Transcript_4634/m.16310 type:complete len:423 (-) Transcript_4634:297-1565(-)
MEQMVDGSGSMRVCVDLLAKPNERARRDVETDPRLAGALLHVDEVTLPLRELLQQRSSVLVVHVDDELLDGLELLAGFGRGVDDARRRDGELESLSAHVLDEDAELQGAPAGHLEHLLHGRHAEGDVVLYLQLETVLDLHCGELRSFLARERRVVDTEGHLQNRRVDRVRRQGLLHCQRAQSVGDTSVGHASDAKDVASASLLEDNVLETVLAEYLQHGQFLHLLSIASETLHLVAWCDGAAVCPAPEDLAEVLVVGEVRHQHREWCVGVAPCSRRGACKDGLEERDHVAAALLGVFIDPAVPRGCVERGVAELLVVGIELAEEVKDLGLHLLCSRRFAVHLIQHNDGLQALAEGLRENELRLCHRALGGIDEQDHCVNQRQDPLHLAAKVAVSRRVHDVHQMATVLDSGGLGHDCDATLLL